MNYRYVKEAEKNFVVFRKQTLFCFRRFLLMPWKNTRTERKSQEKQREVPSSTFERKSEYMLQICGILNTFIKRAFKTKKSARMMKYCQSVIEIGIPIIVRCGLRECQIGYVGNYITTGQPHVYVARKTIFYISA